jgi:hypothetical protein
LHAGCRLISCGCGCGCVRQIKDLARVMHAYPSFAFALHQMTADATVACLFLGWSGRLVKMFKTL